MFERDKDDLRKIGITIEVGGLDPLFDDEAGYRIRPESYALSLGDLTPIQITLLSLATQAWQDAAFSDLSEQALRRFSSMGIENDLSQLPIMAPRLVGTDANLRAALDALTSLKTISFEYLTARGDSELRSLNTFGVQARKSHWYLIGYDLDKAAIRNFRLDRILGEVSSKGSGQSYEIPADFEIGEEEAESSLEIASLKVRPGTGYQLRRLALTVETSDEWDLLEVPILSEDFLTNLILWHGDDVVVQSPANLKELVITGLRKLVAAHG
jgi:proteasome accessory factor B